jgi:D-arabinose 1-dehydrogenase-like Zn-dependent alcohol dehydrogenase
MLALYLEAAQAPRLLDDYPVPRRRAGEALIRLILGGICNTDLELRRGYLVWAKTRFSAGPFFRKASVYRAAR